MRNYTFREKVLRAVALLGLIAVLLLGAWGIIQLAFWLPSLFGNVAGNIGGMFNRGPAAETISMTVPAGVVAGTPFTVRFAHQGGEGERRFALAYQCRDGVSFDTTLADGKTQKVECDTPFNFTAATGTIELTARLTTGTKATPVGLSVAALAVPAGTVMATSSAGTVVSPAATTTTTTTTKPAVTTKPASSGTPSTSYYPSGRTTNLYGAADLSIAINSAYISGGRAAVQFTVTNMGTNVAPANWYFSAQLPINGGYPYTSPTQQALYPGDRIVFTMGYDSFSNYSSTYQTDCNRNNTYAFGQPCWYGPGQTYGGQQTVTIIVDPQNWVYESNELNNAATRTYYSY